MQQAEVRKRRGRPPNRRCSDHNVAANSCLKCIGRYCPELASTATGIVPFSLCKKHNLKWKSCRECTKDLNDLDLGGDAGVWPAAPDDALPLFDASFSPAVLLVDTTSHEKVVPIGLPDTVQNDSSGLLRLVYTPRLFVAGVTEQHKNGLCAIHNADASAYKCSMNSTWSVSYDGKPRVLVVRVTTFELETAAVGETAAGAIARKRRNGVCRLASYVTGKPAPHIGQFDGPVDPFGQVYQYANTPDVRLSLAHGVIAAFCIKCLRRRRLVRHVRRMRAANIQCFTKNAALLQHVCKDIQRMQHVVGGVFTPVTPIQASKRRKLLAAPLDDAIVYGSYPMYETLGVGRPATSVIFPKYRGKPMLTLRIAATSVGRDVPFPDAVGAHSVFTLGGCWHVVVGVSDDRCALQFQPPTSVSRITHRIKIITRADEQKPCFANGLGKPSVAFQVYPRPPWHGGSLHEHVQSLAMQLGSQ